MKNIEERAYLLQGKDKIGVTNDINDLAKVLSELKPGHSVKIEAGFKEELLDKQNTVLRMDSVINAHGQKKILLPERNVDYNLVERNLDLQQFRKFYKFIEPEQDAEETELFGSLIEGSGKDDK